VKRPVLQVKLDAGKPERKKRSGGPRPGHARGNAGIGRKSLYNPAMCEAVFNLRLLRTTDQNIATAIGVSLVTFSRYKIEHPEFMAAYIDGDKKADAKVVRSLWERANGYTHKSEKIFYDSKTGEVIRVPIEEHYPPDTAAMIRWLETRAFEEGWRLKQGVEISGPNGTPLMQPTINILPVVNLAITKE
jgi:hypothetical protein